MANNWKKTTRGLSLKILESVLIDKAYSNIALNHALNHTDFDSKDRALVTELVYGTLSRKLTLEWYLSHYIKDRDKLDTWVYILLLMSVYQILYLDKIPEHAIVNESVSIAKNRGNKKGSEKFVNAVLRRFIASDRPDITSIKRRNKRLSIEYSTPVWLVSKLIEQYGEDRAINILESLFTRSKASLRVIDMANKEELKETFHLITSEIAPTALVSPSGNFSQTDAFINGLVTIQDESSQLVAHYVSPSEDDIILDACSAPGGKTTHMASYLKKGQVIALDLHGHKLRLVEENAKRLGVSEVISTKQMDARLVHNYFKQDSFDKILVDAPCSGIGLIRRKPEIKYQKNLMDLSELQVIQLEILSSVCQTLKKGGIITYSTCTIFDEENKQVIEKFLELHPNFVQIELTHPKEDLIKDGCVVLTPELYQTDGFFIAQMKRVF